MYNVCLVHESKITVKAIALRICIKKYIIKTVMCTRSVCVIFRKVIHWFIVGIANWSGEAVSSAIMHFYLSLCAR